MIRFQCERCATANPPVIEGQRDVGNSDCDPVENCSGPFVTGGSGVRRTRDSRRGRGSFFPRHLPCQPGGRFEKLAVRFDACHRRKTPCFRSKVETVTVRRIGEVPRRGDRFEGVSEGWHGIHHNCSLSCRRCEVTTSSGSSGFPVTSGLDPDRSPGKIVKVLFPVFLNRGVAPVFHDGACQGRSGRAK